MKTDTQKIVTCTINYIRRSIINLAKRVKLSPERHCGGQTDFIGVSVITVSDVTYSINPYQQESLGDCNMC